MKRPTKRQYTVAILMATFNGERYVAEQLDSIAKQTEQDFVLVISDDGSTDETLDVVKRFQSRLGSDRIVIRDGPRKGHGRNFFSMITELSIAADYFVFCDQDDIWEADRLSRAISKMKCVPAHQSALHICSTILIDHEGAFIGEGKRLPHRLSLGSMLLQPVAGGNTMLFNQALVDIIRKTGTRHEADNHDWVLCLINASVGGRFLFEPEPLIRYRQHSSNTMGPSIRIRIKLRRLGMLMDGTFSKWLDNNINILLVYRDVMCTQTIQDFDDFQDMRHKESAFLHSQKLYRKFRRPRSIENLVIRFLLAAKRL